MKIINGLIVISGPLEVSERMGLIGPGKCRRINGISYLSLPDYRRLFKLPQQIHPMQAMHHLPEQICVNDRQIEEGVHGVEGWRCTPIKSLIDFRNNPFTDFKYPVLCCAFSCWTLQAKGKHWEPESRGFGFLLLE